MSEIFNKIRNIQNQYYRVVKDSLTDNQLMKLETFPLLELREYLLTEFSKQTLFIPGSKEKKSALELRFDQLVNNIAQFWGEYSSQLSILLHEASLYSITLESFGFITNLLNTTKRLGIYFDTIFIVDPLHIPHKESRQTLFEHLNWKSKADMMESLSITLRLQELKSNDLDIPIYCIIPDVSNEPDTSYEQANEFLEDVIFESHDIPLMDILVRKTDNQINKMIVNKNIHDELINIYLRQYYTNMGIKSPTAWDVHLFPSNISKPFNLDLDNLPISESLKALQWYTADTFYSYKETIRSSIAFGADPIIESSNLVTYNWFQNKLNNRLKYDLRINSEEETIVTAISKKSLSFLEALSLRDLKKIREKGTLEELRKQLRIERKELRCSPDNDFRVSSEIFANNLFKIINEYSDEFKSITKQKKENLVKTSILLGSSASLGIASLAFSSCFVLGVICATTSILFGGKSLLDLIKEYNEGKRQIDVLHQKPVSLLYKAFSNKQ